MLVRTLDLQPFPRQVQAFLDDLPLAEPHARYQPNGAALAFRACAGKIEKCRLTTWHTKNRFLRDFHKALVEKVVLIENDTSTLDNNQRQAAVAIVSELRDQIASQIEQQAIVESHQKKLHALDGYLHRKDDLDQQQSEKISQLESRALEIIRTDEEQQRLIESLHAAHASKDELDRIQTQRIDALLTAVSQAEMENEKHQRSIDFLQNQQDLLIEQLRSLDATQQAFRSTRARILRSLLPTAALLTGLAALFLSLR